MPHDLGWGLSGELLDRHPRWVPGATTSGQHAFEPCARCSGTQLPARGGGHCVWLPPFLAAPQMTLLPFLCLSPPAGHFALPGP